MIRSFLFEPFNISSGSMLPTLCIGDLILVNKFAYELHLPVLDTPITEELPPKRGDVIVFHYSLNPSIDHIKRIVGLPGDTISYINNHLTINGKEIAIAPMADFSNISQTNYSSQYQEDLLGLKHRILMNMNQPSYATPLAHSNNTAIIATTRCKISLVLFHPIITLPWTITEITLKTLDTGALSRVKIS